MKQSLLRALPFTFALCLALTACGAPAAESDTSTPTSETAETPANPATAAGNTSSTAIGAGEAHLLGETYGGGAAYALRNVYLLGYPGYSVLTRTDYATLAETPVCDKAGCDHLTPDCPAWRFDAFAPVMLFADGNTCYELCDQKNDVPIGDPQLDALREETLAAEGGEARILASDEAGCRRLLAAFAPGAVTGVPGVVETVFGTGVAADAENLYLLVKERDDNEIICAVSLLSVNKETGALRALRSFTQKDADAEGYSLSDILLEGASGRTLYLSCKFISQPAEDGQVTLLGGKALCFDLDTGAWRDGCAWQADPPDAEGKIHRYQVGVSGRPTGWLTADDTAGSLVATDWETGETRELCTGLPAADGKHEAYYQAVETENWYAVTVNEYDRGADGWVTEGSEQNRLFLVPKAGGDPIELPQRLYTTGHGEDTILIRDEWAGQFYCLYAYEEGSYQAINKDGSLYTAEDIRDKYGLIPAEELAAGGTNYRPVTPWNEAAR